jgi:hypothetical protein
VITNIYHNVTVVATINKSDIDDDAEVACVVRLPEIDYERKTTVTYDGKFCCELLTGPLPTNINISDVISQKEKKKEEFLIVLHICDRDFFMPLELDNFEF